MTNRRETNPSDGFSLAQPPSIDPLQRRLVQLEDSPELVPIVTRAVDDVIEGRDIDRQRHADLVADVEQAAVAAALTLYERMADSAIQANDAANEARRALAPLVAANAEVIAQRVSGAAAEVHKVEEATADHLASVAASAAAELAELISRDDETTTSTAAALVVKAVSEAAAVSTSERADAAHSVAQAAADAAADVAEEAASTALAAEMDVITTVLDRHQDALRTCYEVAAAAARAVLDHKSEPSVLDPQHQQPTLQSEPAGMTKAALT